MVKKIGIIILLAFIAWPVLAQKRTQNASSAILKFNKTEYNFGKIFYRSDGSHIFKFVNTGKEPLLLSRLQSSCGCTVPTWPKAPILPGDSGSIKVTYNTYIIGRFNKTVTVYSNAAHPVVLHIRGEVIPRPKPMLPVKQTDKEVSPVKK